MSLLLLIILPALVAAQGCSPCTRCQYPLYDGFRHDADEHVKNVVFGLGPEKAGFATPTFSRSYDSKTGCMKMHAQCFAQVDDSNFKLPPQSGELINAQIPPILPPGSPAARIRRQAPLDRLYNYFIWTPDGRNHSLQSFWSSRRNDINQATFLCNNNAQWEYNYSNSTITQVRGLYCFWIPEDSTKRAFGYSVPMLLSSPVLHV